MKLRALDLFCGALCSILWYNGVCPHEFVNSVRLSLLPSQEGTTRGAIVLRNAPSGPLRSKPSSGLRNTQKQWLGTTKLESPRIRVPGERNTKRSAVGSSRLSAESVWWIHAA